jgi:hypothetical protein
MYIFVPKNMNSIEADGSFFGKKWSDITESDEKVLS